MALYWCLIHLLALFDGIYCFGCFFLAGKAKKSPAWLSEKIKKVPTRFAMNAKGFRQYREGKPVCKPEDSTPLLNLGGNRVNMNGIDYFSARAVVKRVFAASKKNWNVDIIAIPSFDALPSEVKKYTINNYGKEGTLHFPVYSLKKAS